MEDGTLTCAAAVQEATNRYHRDSDVIGAFLEDFCECAPGNTVTIADLYDNFIRWAGEHRDEYDTEKITKIVLGKSLKERGYEQTPSHNGKREWIGIGISRHNNSCTGCTGK